MCIFGALLVNNTITLDDYLDCVKAANNCAAEYRNRSANIRSRLLTAIDSFEVRTLGDVRAFSDTLNAVLARRDQVDLAGQVSPTDSS